MKTTVEALLAKALSTLKENTGISLPTPIEIKVERTKDKTHGDYATNLALIIAKSFGKSPRAVAELLCAHIPSHESIVRIEIAGPGFINFFVQPMQQYSIIPAILKAKAAFGNSEIGRGIKILLEFVSTNPNGPLHVGHGRGAAYGASLANLLSAVGYDVTTEYYVNDAGRQMAILAVSIWIRYLELNGVEITFPANGYRGLYVSNIAQEVINKYGLDFVKPLDISELPLDEPAGGDKEQYIDALIDAAKNVLGKEGFEIFHQMGLSCVLTDIKADLADFGVTFNNWFSERSLLDSGAISQGIEALKAAGYTYEQNGALWFAATRWGDEKDRVLVRANGEPTYFASDVAYHWDKLRRGFDQLINIFGSDHHGYIPRLKAAVSALGHDENILRILIVQFAVLYRGEERVQMSTRSGSFVTLRELREEVGNDAARFFYVMRKSEQHMDFDLELAKSQSNANPVYYIQYAHARISSVFRQLQDRGLIFNEEIGTENISLLTLPSELDLIQLLSKYPEVLENAAQLCEPHQVAYYLRELAAALHSYYNAVTLLVSDQELRDARLCLLIAVRQVIKNGLQLLGVSAPESM